MQEDMQELVSEDLDNLGLGDRSPENDLESRRDYSRVSQGGSVPNWKTRTNADRKVVVHPPNVRIRPAVGPGQIDHGSVSSSAGYKSGTTRSARRGNREPKSAPMKNTNGAPR